MKHIFIVNPIAGRGKHQEKMSGKSKQHANEEDILLKSSIPMAREMLRRSQPPIPQMKMPGFML